MCDAIVDSALRDEKGFREWFQLGVQMAYLNVSCIPVDALILIAMNGSYGIAQ